MASVPYVLWTGSSSDIWTTWNTSTTTGSIVTGAVGTYTGTNVVWNNWIANGTNSSTVRLWEYQQPVWDNWVQEHPFWAEVPLVVDDELQAAREQANRERLAREQQRMADRIVAHSVALDLLDSLLTPDERVTRDTQHFIEVLGTDGRLYRLETHRETVHGNIVRVDEHGCLLARACVAPGMYGEHGALPTADGWVGQYLGLKFDTVEFLSHANWSQHRECHAVAA